ncbi:MAG: hypothetical protein AUK47_05015 [Deltaproteobacteria bacterium CG2_30_63_29]|nr:MAG: hypothetical protein AUK47_05015 [Deltaproteobacteria bacterium CG2_30_63_29]PJB40912.1 MAG: hypothetical protein CO108_13880 [Deltaproteobacteria bacterium CG_4_9_14_3_um_filter_63_12]
MMHLNTFHDVIPTFTKRDDEGTRTGRRYLATNTMTLRVLGGPQPVVRQNTPTPRVRLFDRIHFFTGRLGHFPLQTSPMLGSGFRLVL